MYRGGKQLGCCCCKTLAAMCTLICLKSVKQHTFELKRFWDVWWWLQCLPEAFKWSHFWQFHSTNIFEMKTVAFWVKKTLIMSAVERIANGIVFVDFFKAFEKSKRKSNARDKPFRCCVDHYIHTIRNLGKKYKYISRERNTHTYWRWQWKMVVKQ